MHLGVFLIRGFFHNVDISNLNCIMYINWIGKLNSELHSRFLWIVFVLGEANQVFATIK
jgi:hypothetical protein